MEVLRIWVRNLETKKEIRQKILNQRNALTNEEWSAKSCLILGKLMHHPLYQDAETIYCYVSYKHEVDTWPFLAFSIAAGKRIAVPKVIGQEMKFFYITSLEELEPGYHGIFEPVTDISAEDEHALMIMPVAAFDEENNRIGYGGGYYDRYLKQHPAHQKIGLAFDFQKADCIPAEETDIKPDIIITDKKEGN